MPDELVSVDEAASGRKHRQAGLQALLSSLNRGEAEVVLFFSTSRLYRKVYAALQFVEEQVHEKKRRCVFVTQGIDTADQRYWRQLLQFATMIDEWQIRVAVGFIRAGYQGLLLDELVHSTISFGYGGIEVDGRPTRRNRARRKWQIDETAAEFVQKAFKWYVRKRSREPNS